MTIFVGTSGWQYDDWRERFYPDDVPKRRWLEYFSERFPTVEVNNTFYNLPKEETFVSWRRVAGEEFRFAIKASRFITHVKRLKEPRDPVRLLWSRCERLGRKLGPVLFQLPPNLKADLGRLEDVLKVLPKRMKAAFEFRHDSWKTDETHEMLDDAGCALVLADSPGARVPDIATGGWSYVRFHRGTRTGFGYRRNKLRRWAERLAGLDARDVYAFFNNDPGGAAVRDARTLTELLGESGADVRGPG